MSGERTVRLALVAICNGVLFFFAISDLLNHSQVLFWRILAGVVCAGLAAGVILEALNRKPARLINLGIPSIVGLILASSAMWLPALAKIQHWEHPGDAYEGTPYLLIFSLLPFFLASVIWLTYRMIGGSPDARQGNPGV